jgi:ribosome silencing factor RsfS/YbeB/iojap/nicotinate (nicotinamide) nucleotide adenylyltransferase
MAPLSERLAKARAMAAGERRIRVSSIEAAVGSIYTADTLRALRRRFPRARFVWLMGADNLTQIPYWRRWQEIFLSVPVAVFARPGAAAALAGAAARRFARWRIKPGAARRLAIRKPPAWAFFHARLDPRSATDIRARRVRSAVQEQRPTVTAETAPIVSIVPRPAPRRRQKLTPAELLRLVIASLEDGKAENIVTLDLAGKTPIADYMVIASGRSARQVAALTEHLEQALPGRVAVEGKAHGDWVLLDAGDVIVHLFRPETRAYYNLEKMWGADVAELEAASLP